MFSELLVVFALIMYKNIFLTFKVLLLTNMLGMSYCCLVFNVDAV